MALWLVRIAEVPASLFWPCLLAAGVWAAALFRGLLEELFLGRWRP